MWESCNSLPDSHNIPPTRDRIFDPALSYRILDLLGVEFLFWPPFYSPFFTTTKLNHHCINMINPRDVRLMEKRMKILNTALFSNYSLAVFKFPSCLVSKVKFNAEGDVLFSIGSAYEDMSGFELEFPGHMLFFNKDFDYYIEAQGKASATVKGMNVGIRFYNFHAQYFYSAKMQSKGLIRLFYNFMDFLFVRKMSERLYDYPNNAS